MIVITANDQYGYYEDSKMIIRDSGIKNTKLIIDKQTKKVYLVEINKKPL